jgi:hypothetical protein
MLDNNHKLWLLLLVPVVALLFFLGAFFFFYRGGYDAPPLVDIPFEQITRTTSISGQSTFADQPGMQLPGMELQRGTLLVDAAHSNSFDQEEVLTLFSRVADRGYDVEFAGDFDFGTMSESERLPLLEDKLHQADSFAVILPEDSYTRAEVSLVEQFVEKGGNLLLIADPTRNHDINSLAEQFGLEFQPDYLYNAVAYDLNFQHIFVRNFQPDMLTQGLDEITLYTAGSIKTSGTGLAFTDQNTVSSFVEPVEPFYPIARGEQHNVLAVYDLTFMIPPHNTVMDNDQLVSNIADYLTTSQREFHLADFPSFFKEEVDILLGQPSLLNIGTDFKNTLAGFQIDSEIRSTEDTTRDTVFLGLYEDSALVAPYLEASGVQVGDTLRLPATQEIDPAGTSIILLNRSQDRHVMVVLAHSEDALSNAVSQLGSGDFRSGLVDDFVGVYQTP